MGPVSSCIVQSWDLQHLALTTLVPKHWKHLNCDVGYRGKVRESPTSLWVHPLGTMNVCIIFHGIPLIVVEIFQFGQRDGEKRVASVGLSYT